MAKKDLTLQAKEYFKNGNIERRHKRTVIVAFWFCSVSVICFAVSIFSYLYDKEYGSLLVQSLVQSVIFCPAEISLSVGIITGEGRYLSAALLSVCTLKVVVGFMFGISVWHIVTLILSVLIVIKNKY
ncbi:MAG: hypothetical protein IJB86_06395 [Clostridia bacterium]|nr:hypothetical protein [Clostridia bacterium]